MERTSRKVYRGTVVSDKMDKTIVVEVSTSKTHPLYNDELNQAGIGDIVEIMETRKLSATKNFRLIKVIQKAVVL